MQNSKINGYALRTGDKQNAGLQFRPVIVQGNAISYPRPDHQFNPVKAIAEVSAGWLSSIPVDID